MKRVGLLGPSDREELDLLAMRLEERGAQGIVLDPRGGARVRVTADAARACGHDLGGLCAVYVADLGLPAASVRTPDGRLDAEASAAAAASSRRHLSAWNTLLERLGSRIPVVNPPATHELHGLKPWEMATYRRAGIPVPATLASGDPEALLALEPTRARIRKGLVGGYGYTEPFEVPPDLARARALVADGPLLVQERVEGDNVRAFVVGDELVGAAEIVPTAGGVDSRRGDVRVRAVALDDQGRASAIGAARCFGLRFCAVDLMRDARAGRYAVLECNSAPFFAAFERTSGIDVSSPLADHLLGRSRT